MPSGKNSGSHGSGGSHFNNSSSSGTHSSSNSGHIHFGRSMLWGPSVVVINGRRYNRTRSKGGTISTFFIMFFCVIAFMVLMFGIVMFSNGNNQTEYIMQDYRYYQNMIARAEIANEAGEYPYKAKAQITAQKFNPEAKKWYIEYQIPLTGMLGYLEGESYAIYDDNEIMSPALAVDSYIDVAVSSSTITFNTDSIPMDYKNIAPEKDGQYANALSLTTNGRNMMIGAGVGMAVLVLLAIVLNKATSKLTEVKEESANPEPAKGKKTDAPDKKTDSYDDEVSYCQYCGARIKKSTKKCPQCGAKLN